MNNYYSKGEISTMLILGTLVVAGVATLLNTTLNKTPQDVGTKAQTLPACPYNSGQTVQLGQTESDANNMEARWPISQHRHEYDFFSYFVPATSQEARSSKMTVYPTDQYLSYFDIPPGGMDSNLIGMMGRMFEYKPTRLADAYFMKYDSVELQGQDTLVKGISPALKVPIVPGDPVYMPDTLYSIGGSMEAMVVFAESDRITLHLGRHEYLVGSGNNCNGRRCSGGIWLYIRGICVDSQILDKYNSIKAIQEAAGPDKNPIMLPMVEAGRVLGNALGNEVEVVMRDNGPLMSIHKPGFWEGVPVKDVSQGNITSTPRPTITPSPTLVVTLDPIKSTPTSVLVPSDQLKPTITFVPDNTPTLTPTEPPQEPVSPQVTNMMQSTNITQPGRIESYTIELTEDVLAVRCPDNLNVSEEFCILLQK